MNNYIDVTAKTVEQAMEDGRRKAAEMNREVTSIDVLEQPSNGFLGIGRKQALVRVFLKAEDSAVEEPVAENSSEADVDSLERAELKAAVAMTVEEAEDAVKSVVNEVESAVKGLVEDSQRVEPMEEVTGPSHEEIVEIATKGKEFLQEMLTKMGVTVMIERMIVGESITFQIHGDDLGILIGKHGQTLDAIQYLTNLVANKEGAFHCHITVDVENYRTRREETLTRLAHRKAEQVKRTKQKVVFEPMTAYERKIIHMALQDDKHVATDSEGEDAFRHVVITYKR